MKKLTEAELEKRRATGMFFKNGKPKKMYMLCRDASYQSEVRSINGYCSFDQMCGGLRCPLYPFGCDDRGEAWE